MTDLNQLARFMDACEEVKQGCPLPDAVVFGGTKGMIFEGGNIKSNRFYVPVSANQWALFERHNDNKDCFVAITVTGAPVFDGTPLLNACVYWKREAAYAQVQQDLERLKTKWRDWL